MFDPPKNGSILKGMKKKKMLFLQIMSHPFFPKSGEGNCKTQVRDL